MFLFIAHGQKKVAELKAPMLHIQCVNVII